MENEKSSPFVLECPCGEVYIAAVVHDRMRSSLSEFSCLSCPTKLAVSGRIISILRRIDVDRWQELERSSDE